VVQTIGRRLVVGGGLRTVVRFRVHLSRYGFLVGRRALGRGIVYRGRVVGVAFGPVAIAVVVLSVVTAVRFSGRLGRGSVVVLAILAVGFVL
jgi:hypothetical protein